MIDMLSLSCYVLMFIKVDNHLRDIKSLLLKEEGGKERAFIALIRQLLLGHVYLDGNSIKYNYLLVLECIKLF